MTGDSRAWLDEVDQVIDSCLASLRGQRRLSAKRGPRNPVPDRPDLLRQEILLSGSAVKHAFGLDEWRLRWLIPAIDVLRLPEGESRIFGYRARLKPSGSKDRKSLKLNGVADLDQMEIVSTWSDFVENAWGRFARKLDRKGEARIEWFLGLEAVINSLWVSGKSRNLALMSPLTGNPLRRLEERRKVEITLNPRGDGPLRRPHHSHEGRLCPYHTPESERIGLQLHLTADAVIEDKAIRSGRSRLSLAVGLVPHGRHNDGPRLLMGGKNLKQAEAGIRGEPSRIPGDCEGHRLRRLDLGGEAIEKGRLFPYLGVNALVAVMPWEGLTYEDGLVVSRSFAERLALPEATLEQRETLLLEESSPATLTQKELQREVEALVGCYCRFDDPLPLPPTLRLLGFRPRRYHWNDRARLDSVTVRLLQGRPRGKGRTRRQPLEVRLLYRFSLNRPLAIGDKITGRHGNKGVVTAILDRPPQALIDGQNRDIDLIISPCSIIGRKNFGQIAEMVQSLFTEDIASETDRNWRQRLPDLKGQGADDGGRFEIDCGDGRKGRAFCGYQYICRLHHHSAKKLQARGDGGPRSTLLSEPIKAGTLSGQRLGEMENWAILSHDGAVDAEDFLTALRKQNSPPDRTWRVFRTILRSLGLDVVSDGIGIITTAARGEPLSLQEGIMQKLPQAEARREGPAKPSAEEPLYLLDFAAFPETTPSDASAEEDETPSEAVPSLPSALAASLLRLAGKPERLPSCGEILRLLSLFERSQVDGAEHPMAGPLRELARLPRKPQDGEKDDTIPLEGLLFFLAWTDASTGPRYGFPFDPAIVEVLDDTASIRRVLTALLSLAYGKGENLEDLLDALSNYRKKLVGLLKGKKGLLRGHLLGRRYNRTGRAVIVPRPGLRPDETLLPASMIARILDGHGSARQLIDAAGLDESDWQSLRRGDGTADLFRRLNEALNEHPFWVLLIRQPSLHRHNAQAFRVRCHGENVIGLPPLATPGYNADFDGDTMAVVVPPEGFEDLSSWSLVFHPGLLGTGAPALSAENDLALGWLALSGQRRLFWLTQAGLKEQERQKASLSDLLLGLCRGHSAGDLAETLGTLQAELAKASTASCSLGPLELEALWNDGNLAELREEAPRCRDRAAGDLSGDGTSHHRRSWEDLRRKMEEAVKTFLKRQGDGDLVRLISGKAKGKPSDLVQGMGCLGFQEEAAVIEDFWGPDLARAWITACLWEGLSEKDLFLYSYESRRAMASKKLLVAQGGYLARRLAEGLYDSRITEDDCLSEKGLSLSFRYGPEGQERIRLATGGDPLDLFEADPGRALSRIAWGRCPVGMKRLLDGDDLSAILGYWKEGRLLKKKDLADHMARNGGSLVLRSPLTCRTSGRGLCACCAGADRALMPFDRPAFQKIGRPVGLDAAMAIGERGTQLSMKAFHDVGSKVSSAARLEELLLNRRKKGSLPEEIADLLSLLEDEGNNLPQALIHYEIALRAPGGLAAWADDDEKRWLAALAYERLDEKLQPGRRDDLSGLKSSVLLRPVSLKTRGEQP